jgi:hypothetical protein
MVPEESQLSLLDMMNTDALGSIFNRDTFGQYFGWQDLGRLRCVNTEYCRCIDEKIDMPLDALRRTRIAEAKSELLRQFCKDDPMKLWAFAIGPTLGQKNCTESSFVYLSVLGVNENKNVYRHYSYGTCSGGLLSLFASYSLLHADLRYDEKSLVAYSEDFERVLVCGRRNFGFNFYNNGIINVISCSANTLIGNVRLHSRACVGALGFKVPSLGLIATYNPSTQEKTTVEYLVKNSWGSRTDCIDPAKLYNMFPAYALMLAEQAKKIKPEVEMSFPRHPGGYSQDVTITWPCQHYKYTISEPPSEFASVQDCLMGYYRAVEGSFKQSNKDWALNFFYGMSGYSMKHQFYLACVYLQAFFKGGMPLKMYNECLGGIVETLLPSNVGEQMLDYDFGEDDSFDEDTDAAVAVHDMLQERRKDDIKYMVDLMQQAIPTMVFIVGEKYSDSDIDISRSLPLPTNIRQLWQIYEWLKKKEECAVNQLLNESKARRPPKKEENSAHNSSAIHSNNDTQLAQVNKNLTVSPTLLQTWVRKICCLEISWLHFLSMLSVVWHRCSAMVHRLF